MNKPKSAAKLPKGRVMYQGVKGTLWMYPDTEINAIPVLVLPMPTVAAAEKRLRFEKLSREQKVEALAKVITAQLLPNLPWCDVWRDVKERHRVYARQLLSLI